MDLFRIVDDDVVTMGYFCKFTTDSGEEIRLLFEGDVLGGEELGSFYGSEISEDDC